MGGADAAKGFAYQHAQALHRVVDLVDLDGASYVRVEAANDVVDVEIYAEGDTLVHAAQFKTRDQKYTWGVTELVEELVRWSSIAPAHPEAQYEFVTDGRLGPSGRKFQAALEENHRGNSAKLVEIARKQDAILDPNSCVRASIVAETPGFDQLIDCAIDRVTNLLPHVTGALEAEERAMQTVLELLRIIVERSGEVGQWQRIITRAELDEVLTNRREYVATESWSYELKNAFLEAVQRQKPKGVTLRCEVMTSGFPAGRRFKQGSGYLDELIDSSQVTILSGPAGSGKSTVIQQAQVAAALRGEVIIIANAEHYIPNRLGSLIASGINGPGFVGAYSTTGIKALGDPDVTVILDNVSEIPATERTSLKADIKQLVGSDVRARLALSGRDAIVLQGFLPRNTPVNPVVIEPLDRKIRIEIISDISNGVIEHRHAQMITARVEHALQGAANNPQFFLVGATLVADGSDFNGYSRLSVVPC